MPGTELDIVIHLPNGTDCKLKGLVRRSMKTPIVSLKNGMGIELISRDHNYIRFLKEFDPAEDGEPTMFSGEQRSHAQHKTQEQHHKPSSDPAPDSVIIACDQCGAKNRVSRERLSHGPKCGKCGAPISLQS